MNKFFAALCAATALITAPMVQAAEVALPPFYQKVTQMKPSGPLGKVIAKEKVATSIPGAEAWRVAYISSDVLDRPTIATGLVIAPKGKPPKKGRPIVAWAHGTTGTAQNCGPSQVNDPAQDLNEYFLIGGTSWTDFGVPAATDFIKQGYVLVATDYQGLGGGGKHQYNNSATQTRDIFDSIRAVGSMGLSGSNKKALIYGWSQGGGAVLAAAGNAAYLNKKNTSFDGVELVGAVALAPMDVNAVFPAGIEKDQVASTKALQGLIEQFSSNVFNFAHATMTLWAMEGTYPELKLTDLFTADGVAMMNAIYSKKCMHAGADTMNFAVGDGYKAFVLPQPTNTQAWVARMMQSSVPAEKPFTPVIIYWGSKDTTNPPIMGEIYRKQKCAMGANVTRVELPGQSHFTTPPVSQPMYTQWVKDRFDGKPAPDGCKS